MIYKHALIIMAGLVSCMETSGKAKERRSTWCGSFFCENDSPCLIANVTNKNGTETIDRKCICTGSYIGPRCKAKLKLSAREISPISISLQMTLAYTDASDNSTSNIGFYDNLVYTLQYWSNDSDSTCAIISDVKTQTYVIKGLENDRTYIVCAQSGSIGWCFPEINITSPNCIIFSTHSSAASDEFTSSVILPVALIVVVFLLVILISVIIFERRHFRYIVNINKRIGRRKNVRKSSHQSEYDFFLTPMSSPSPKPVFRPPSSPGRPQHIISNQTQGYASFSTRNNQTIALKTVLEYVPGDTTEENETTLMLPATSSFRADDK